LSFNAYSQEDTGIIKRVFDFMNDNFRQNIADSMYPPAQENKFPKAGFYRNYVKRKKKSDEIYLHAFYIPCTMYYVYDSTITKVSYGKIDSITYPQHIFHSKEYNNQAFMFDKSKYKKRYYTFYFINDKHFKVIKVNTGPEKDDCVSYFNKMIFGTSEQFAFELNDKNEVELKSASMTIHN
jgi:hypothetical protein